MSVWFVAVRNSTVLVQNNTFIFRNEGHFTLSKKCTRFFHNERILTDFWWIFLDIKGIFAKGIRDFLGVKCPSFRKVVENLCYMAYKNTAKSSFKKKFVYIT